LSLLEGGGQLSLLEEIRTRPVYLDGSGSTDEFWSSATGRNLYALLTKRSDTYWATETRVLRASVFFAELGGVPDFVAMGTHRKENHPREIAYFLTDVREEAEEFLFAAAGHAGKAYFKIVTFKELEKEMQSRSCSCGAACGCSLSDDLRYLEDELDKILRDSDNQQQRNKRAIEIHGKLDRLVGQVEALPKTPENKLLAKRTQCVVEKLLIEVFRIDPERAEKARTESASGSTPATWFVNGGLEIRSTESLANNDVAAVRVVAKVGTQTFPIDGSAKRNPEDAPNKEIGLAVAYSDALHKITRRVDQHVRELLAAADKERKQVEAEKNQRRADARKAQSAARARRTQKQLQDDVANLRAQLVKAQAVKKAAPKKAAVKQTPAKKAAPKKKA
jgi:hypothetical protein